MWGRHGETTHIRTVATATTTSCCTMMAHAPPPRAAMTIATTAPIRAAAIWRSSSARKFIARVNRASWVTPERDDQEAERHGDEQRLDGRLPVEVGDEAGHRDADDRADGAGRDAHPEDGRAVALGERRALDQGGAQGEVGEDVDQAGEDQHEGREAVVVRREEAREDDAHDHPRALLDPDGDDLPQQAVHDGAAQVRAPARGILDGPAGWQRGGRSRRRRGRRGGVHDPRRAAGGRGDRDRGAVDRRLRAPPHVVCGDRIAPTTVVTPPHAAHCR